MKSTMVETRSEKADRLKNSFGVILTGSYRAVVIGDHDTYSVTRSRPGQWHCTCPWARYRGHSRNCSHILAARRGLMDPQCQVPVARLADMLIGAAESQRG